MRQEEWQAWRELKEKFKRPSKNAFRREIDLSDTQLEDTGKLTLEQLIYILDTIKRADEDEAIVLPSSIQYTLDPRYVLKNLERIELRRIKSKRKAIEEGAEPLKLIAEKIEELREKYLRDSKMLVEKEYGWINYRGIIDKKNKNFLASDAIEGYLLEKEAGNLIKVKRYDTLEQLLKNPSLSQEERRRIAQEARKIKKRKTLTQKEIETPGFIREEILNKQAERIVKVPSRSKIGTYYRIRFRKLPLKYNDGKFSELDKLFLAQWTNLYTEPSCNCEEKMWFINYIKPGELYHCVHEIAAFRRCIRDDYREHALPPYIATSQFFKPTQEAIEFYKKLRNQVFVKKVSYDQNQNPHFSYEHISKPYVESLLIKQVIRGMQLFVEPER
jgi:hypothetical protein